MKARRAFWLFVGLLVCGLVVLRGAMTQSMARALIEPARIDSNGADWFSGGPYGGDVQALALSPEFGTDGIAMAGGWRQGRYGPTGGYGIARTADGGLTWVPVFDGPPFQDIAVFDVAISPGFAIDSTAFAPDSTAFAATDHGVLRSTDSGVGWAALTNGLPGPGNDQSADDMAFVRISPNFPVDDTMLAGQRDGALFRSTDRGDTWQSSLAGETVFTAAFSRNYGVSALLFAAQFDGVGATRLMSSSDGGQTWDERLVLAGLQVNDMVESGDGALLLATSESFNLPHKRRGVTVVGVNLSP